MVRKWSSVLIASALVLNAVYADTAQAQYGRHFMESLPQLNADDIAMLKRTGREDMDGKPVGTTLQWRNARSGNAGTVTLLRRFNRDGRECRRLQHDLNLVNQGAQRYVSTICRQADGTWKLVQEP